MELLFLKVCFLSCCWGLFWVEKLAEPREGLLKFVHKYYPKKLEGALNCAVCVSGWLSMFSLCALSPFYGLILLPLALLAPAVCFVMVKGLEKLIF